MHRLCWVAAAVVIAAMAGCSGGASPESPSVSTATPVEIRVLEGGFRCVAVELVEGKPVPREVVQVGAICDPSSDGRAFGVSTVKSCLNGKTLSNDTRGWWWEGEPYHLGRSPQEATDTCHFGTVRPPTTVAGR